MFSSRATFESTVWPVASLPFPLNPIKGHCDFKAVTAPIRGISYRIIKEMYEESSSALLLVFFKETCQFLELLLLTEGPG